MTARAEDRDAQVARLNRRAERAALYSVAARAEAKRLRRIAWARAWEADLAAGNIRWGTCRGDLSPFDPTKPRAIGVRALTPGHAGER